MTSPLEILKSLPPETPLSAAHIVAILESLQSNVTPQEHTPSRWDSEKLIDEQTLCDWLGESPDTVNKWRVKGTGPQFLKGPKNVRYQVGHVREWLKSRTVSSTSEASVKGLSRYVVENPSSAFTAFPVFTYANGLRLDLAASIEHEAAHPEMEPTLLSIANLGGGSQPGAALSDDMARWLYVQFLQGRLSSHLPLLHAVRLRVAEGFDINQINLPTGYTMAHVLALNQHGFTHEQYFNEFVIELMDFGLDLNKPDGLGMSALEMARTRGGHHNSPPLLTIWDRRSFAEQLEVRLVPKKSSVRRVSGP